MIAALTIPDWWFGWAVGFICGAATVIVLAIWVGKRYKS